MRKSWDEYFMDIASMVATRSTCPKRQVGAVLVKDKRIVSTGYNGAPTGAAHCDDIGCDLTLEGRCVRTIHAERNALDYKYHPQSTLYTTDFPCLDCARYVVMANITRVVYNIPYKRTENEVLSLFHEKGIIVEQLVSSSEAERRAVNSDVVGSIPS